MPLLSLSKFDQSWQTTLAESALLGFWLKFKLLCWKHLSALSGLGNFCEIASFLLVLLLFFILPAPQFADDKGKLALIVLAAFGLRSMAILLNDKLGYKTNALDFAVLAFLGMNVIATAASHYLPESIKGLSKMLVYFCSYFLFVACLERSTTRRTVLILAALLGSGLLVSLYGVYQYKIGVAPLATWEDPSIEDKTTRVYATLKNPNLLAGYLVPLIPLSLGLSFMSFCQKGWKRLLGLPVLCAAGVIALCTVFTGSRGGYMGIGAGLFTMAVIVLNSIWSSKPKLRPLLVLLIFVVPALLVLALHYIPQLHPYEHRILSIFAGREHSSNSYRMNVYIASFKMFLHSWWIGVGPGNSTFKLAYGLYMKSSFDALGTYCVPLEVAVETGVVGLSCFALMIVAALARAHQQFWSNSFAPERWVAAGAAAGLVAMMVHGLVDTVYYRPQVQFIFWLLLALCICVNKNGQKENTSDQANVQESTKLEDQNNAAA